MRARWVVPFNQTVQYHPHTVDNIGLYRNDGLAIIRKELGLEIECTRKKLISIFKIHGLKVTADTSLF